MSSAPTITEKSFMMLPDSVMGYVDGIAAALTVFALSPPRDRIRNAVAVGVVHGVLHRTACSYLK